MNADTLRKIQSAAQKAVKRVIAEMPEDERNNPNRRGVRIGIGFIEQTGDLTQVKPVKVGEIEDVRDIFICSYFAMEKITRTFLYGHKLSRESRDEEKFRYAGCIALGRWYISCSGFQEEDDEKVVRYIILEIFGAEAVRNHPAFPKIKKPVAEGDRTEEIVQAELFELCRITHPNGDELRRRNALRDELATLIGEPDGLKEVRRRVIDAFPELEGEFEVDAM